VTANAIAVATDDVTLEDDGGTPGALRVKDGGIDSDALAASVAGAGLTGGAGSALAVGAAAASAITVTANAIAVATDDATLEDDGGTPGALRVKALGIDTSHLASGAVQPSKADLGAGMDWDFSSADSVSVPTPSSNAHAVTKAYVDAIASGLSIKDACRVATAAALPACTPAGSKVGKTLTINAVGILTIDGINTVLNDRILVKNQVAADDNGIYAVTTEGTGGVAAVLTRATDFDEDDEVKDGAFTFIGEGTVNASTGWVLTTNNPITVDTTSLDFSQFSGAGLITAGAGLTKTGNILDVGQNAAGAIKVNADDIEVITDDVTLEDDGSAAPAKLRVKDLGIDTAQLAASAVETAKINNAAVDMTKLNADVAGDGIQGGAGSALAVDVSDFAGSGLEDDGSENLRIAAAAAGDGLQGGAGSALAVDVSDFAGTGLEDDGSENLRLAAQGNGIDGGAGSTLSVKADAEVSVVVDADGVRAAVPLNANKAAAPADTTGDESDTGLTIVSTPAADSYVQVLVNGLQVELGNGVVTKDCYFSSDGTAVNVRAIAAIAAGDHLVWNGVVAKYELKVAKDVVDMNYNFVA
jgi:hypothetical protein